MALFDVGKSVIDIRLAKRDGKIYKLNIEGKVSVKRTKNSASVMTFTGIRDHISIEGGELVAFRLDEQHDIFYGTVEDASKSMNRDQVTCYDQLKFMKDDSHSQNYGEVPVSVLTNNICNDFNYTTVDPPNIIDTEFVLPEVVMQNASPLDTIIDGINTTYRNTGRMFVIYDMFNNICLDTPTNDQTLKIDTYVINHYNCQDYTYKENYDGIKNQIIVETKEENLADRKKAVARNEDSIHQYGLRTYTCQVDDGESIDNVANTLLEQKSQISYSLSVSGAIGDPRVYGGSLIYVDLFTNGLEDQREFIRGWFLVQSVTHNFENGTHLMDLEMDLFEMEDDWGNTEGLI